MIRTEGLGFSRPSGQAILRDINLEITRQDSCAIIGPTGCGKTTLLHLLAGLLRPHTGRILIAGQERQAPRPATGIILQNLGLFPWKTVLENVALGLNHSRSPDPVIIARQEQELHTMLTELQLTSHLSKYPHQLSGGQRQRVAIARCLVAHPDLLLMDEAASALDALSRERLQDLILNIRIRSQLTLVVVTHSIEEAVILGRTLLVMGVHGTVSGFPNPVNDDCEPRNHPEFAQTCRKLRARLAQEGPP